ncbi:MAG TPA: hypothetical protein VFW98_10075 [Gemmatimonadaceae bacterium]|nr:hypothetical protein [Gemmatimonadaceae bacterium]
MNPAAAVPDLAANVRALCDRLPAQGSTWTVAAPSVVRALRYLLDAARALRVAYQRRRPRGFSPAGALALACHDLDRECGILPPLPAAERADTASDRARDG